MVLFLSRFQKNHTNWDTYSYSQICDHLLISNQYRTFVAHATQWCSADNCFSMLMTTWNLVRNRHRFQCVNLCSEQFLIWNNCSILTLICFPSIYCDIHILSHSLSMQAIQRISVHTGNHFLLYFQLNIKIVALCNKNIFCAIK